jgi:ATP/maltotriose-dependent transcriptional regulator MalT
VTRIVLVEPNFVRRQGLQHILEELGAEEAVPALSPSCLLLIDGATATNPLALERMLRVQGLRIVLVLWRAQALASWTDCVSAFAIVDLFGEESAVRDTLQRVVGGEATGISGVEPLPQLTHHELRVLLGIAAGRSNRELAHDLGVSIATVDSLRAEMLRRIQPAEDS